MNHTKITATIKLFVFNCFKSSIPTKIISEALNVNYMTVENFLSTQKFPKELKEFQPNTNELKAHLLTVYSWILADADEAALMLGPESTFLLKPLHKHLKLNEWEAFLDGVVAHHVHLAKHTFENVPDGYQKLINDIIPSEYIDTDGKGMLEQFLIKAHIKDHHLFPNASEINDMQKSLDKCIDIYFADEKKGLKFDLSIVQSINEILDERSTNREKEIIFAKYKIQGSLDEIKSKYAISDDQIRPTSIRVLNMIHIQLSELPKLVSINFVLNVQKEIKDMQLQIKRFEDEKLRLKGIMELTNHHLSHVFKASIDINYKVPLKTVEFFKDSFVAVKTDSELLIPTLDSDQNKSLLLHLSNLDLSVRAYNVLTKGLKIQFLWQLCELEYEDLWVSRNCGIGTCEEIKKSVSDHRLSLDMQFSQYRHVLISKTGR